MQVQYMHATLLAGANIELGREGDIEGEMRGRKGRQGKG